jgi:hypothetical protein
VAFGDEEWTGVFEPLRDPARFAKVTVEGGTIVWPEDGLDMPPSRSTKPRGPTRWRRLHSFGRCVQGRSVATYRQPLAVSITATKVASDVPDRASLTPEHRRVLVALRRPFKESSGYVTPARNQEIADELFLSVDAIKTHLRALFAKVGIEDLPQNQKRVRSVELALKTGVLTVRELGVPDRLPGGLDWTASAAAG